MANPAIPFTITDTVTDKSGVSLEQKWRQAGIPTLAEVREKYPTVAAVTTRMTEMMNDNRHAAISTHRRRAEMFILIEHEKSIVKANGGKVTDYEKKYHINKNTYTAWRRIYWGFPWAYDRALAQATQSGSDSITIDEFLKIADEEREKAGLRKQSEFRGRVVVIDPTETRSFSEPPPNFTTKKSASGYWEPIETTGILKDMLWGEANGAITKYFELRPRQGFKRRLMIGRLVKKDSILSVPPEITIYRIENDLFDFNVREPQSVSIAQIDPDNERISVVSCKNYPPVGDVRRLTGALDGVVLFRDPDAITNGYFDIGDERFTSVWSAAGLDGDGWLTRLPTHVRLDDLWDHVRFRSAEYLRTGNNIPLIEPQKVMRNRMIVRLSRTGGLLEDGLKRSIEGDPVLTELFTEEGNIYCNAADGTTYVSRSSFGKFVKAGEHKDKPVAAADNGTEASPAADAEVVTSFEWHEINFVLTSDGALKVNGEIKAHCTEVYYKHDVFIRDRRGRLLAYQEAAGEFVAVSDPDAEGLRNKVKWFEFDHMRFFLTTGGMVTIDGEVIADNCSELYHDDSHVFVRDASDGLLFVYDEQEHTFVQSDEPEGEAEDTSGEQPEATGEQPEATGEQPEATSGEQPEATGEQPEATGEQPEATGEQPEATSGEQPEATGDQPKATGEQPEATGDQPKATGEQPEATGEQPEATGDQPKATGEQPEATGEAKPEANYSDSDFFQEDTTQDDGDEDDDNEVEPIIIAMRLPRDQIIMMIEEELNKVIKVAARQTQRTQRDRRDIARFNQIKQRAEKTLRLFRQLVDQESGEQQQRVAGA